SIGRLQSRNLASFHPVQSLTCFGTAPAHDFHTPTTLPVEDRMLKPVIAATALVAVVGFSLVYAQQRFDGPRSFSDGSPRVDYRHRFGVEDVAAFADARIAALKAGLALTPDQAKNWPPLEAALRNMVALRIERIKARQAAEQQSPASPFDRLARRADNMSKA